MVCADKKQAERVAATGAAKMTAEKYEIKGASLRSLAGKQYRVVNRETGVTYHTSVDPKATWCTCPFFRDNRAHGTCKHIEKCREEAADEARYEATARMMAEAWGEDNGKW